LRMIYPLALSEIKIPASELPCVQSVFFNILGNLHKHSMIHLLLHSLMKYAG